jgi:hypothetical protein
MTDGKGMGTRLQTLAANRRTVPLVLLASSLWFPVTSAAQVGVKVGVAASGFRATHSDERVWTGEDYRPFLGYEVDRLQNGDAYPALDVQLGVTYTRSVTDRFAAQPELHLALRGLRWDQVGQYDEAYELDVAYLQIPLLLRLAGPTGWRVRPNLLLGPYVARRLSANRR